MKKLLSGLLPHTSLTLGAVVFLVFSGNLAARSSFTEGTIQRTIREVVIYDNIQEPDAPRPAREGVDVLRGQMGLRTGLRSRAELLLNEGSLVRIGSNAVFSFADNQRDLFLGQGTMLLQVPPGQGRTTITTQNATAAITGTTILLDNSSTYTKLIVLEGTVTLSLRNRLGERITLRAGQMLIWDPEGDRLPEAVDIDLAALKESSDLVRGFSEENILELTKIEEEAEFQKRLQEDGLLQMTDFRIPGRGTTVHYGLRSGGLGQPTFHSLIDRPTEAGNDDDTDPRRNTELRGGLDGDGGDRDSGTPTTPPQRGVTGGTAGPEDRTGDQPPPPVGPSPLSTIPLAPDALGDNSLLTLNPTYFEDGEFVGLGYIYVPGSPDGSFSQVVFGANPTAFADQVSLDAGIDAIINNLEQTGMTLFAFDQLAIDGSFGLQFDPLGNTSLSLISDSEIQIRPGSSVFLNPSLSFLGLIARSGGIEVAPGSWIGINEGFFDLFLYNQDPNASIRYSGNSFDAEEMSLFSAGDLLIFDADISVNTLNLVAGTDLTVFGGEISISADQLLLNAGGTATLDPNAFTFSESTSFALFANQLILDAGMEILAEEGGEGPPIGFFNDGSLDFFPGSSSEIRIGTGGIDASRAPFASLGINNVGILTSLGNVSIDFLSAENLIEIQGNLSYSEYLNVLSGNLSVSGAITEVPGMFSPSGISVPSGNIFAGDIESSYVMAGGSIFVAGDAWIENSIESGSDLFVGGDLMVLFGNASAGNDINVVGQIEAFQVEAEGEVLAGSGLLGGALTASNLVVSNNFSAESVSVSDSIIVGGDLEIETSALAGNDILVGGNIIIRPGFESTFAEEMIVSAGNAISADIIKVSGASQSQFNAGGQVIITQEEGDLRIATAADSYDGLTAIRSVQADAINDGGAEMSRDGGLINISTTGPDASITVTGRLGDGIPTLSLSARSTEGSLIGANFGVGGEINLTTTGPINVEGAGISVGSIGESFNPGPFNPGFDSFSSAQLGDGSLINSSTVFGGEIRLQSEVTDSTQTGISVRNSSQLLSLVNASVELDPEEIRGLIELISSGGEISVDGAKLIANKGSIDIINQDGPISIRNSLLLADIIAIQAQGSNGNIFINNSTLQAVQTLSINAGNGVFFSGNNILRSEGSINVFAGSEITVSDGVTRLIGSANLNAPQQNFTETTVGPGVRDLTSGGPGT